MATVRGILLVRSCKTGTFRFSTSCLVYNKWRRMQGLEPNPRAFGPLTNLPDYSFLDGRPVPLGHFKRVKLEYQQHLCKKISELTNEIDIGLKEYHEKMEEKKQEREAILQSKLKPKGISLLKRKKL